jgi:aspartate aminotransferase
MKEAFAARRELFCSLLAQIPGVKFVRPSGAVYSFAHVSAFRMESMEFCGKLMDEAHIAAAPGCGFGSDGFIRFSYACSEDVIRRALARFGDFCAALK